MKPKRLRLLSITAGALAVVVLIPVVLVMAHFADHSLPKTSVAGVDVSGQNRTEVLRTVDTAFDGRTVQLRTPEGEALDVAFQELGISIDSEAVTDQVMLQGEGPFSRLVGLFTQTDVVPEVQVQDQVALDYLVSSGLYTRTEPDYTPVSFDDQAGVFVANVPDELMAADVDALQADLSQRLAEADMTPVDLQYQAQDSETFLAKASEAASLANDWLARDVELVAEDKVLATAAADQKASWFNFVSDLDGIEPELNVGAIQQWVESAGEAEAKSGRPAVQNVDSDGQVLREVDPGEAGVGLLDSDIVAQEVAKVVTSGQGTAVPVEFGTVAPDVMKLPVSAGGSLPYDPKPGERWIDVDITNARITAYEGTEPVMVLPTVPGSAKTPTIEGIYQIQSKVAQRDMSGFNPDGSTYYYQDVPYALYFHGSYAIHGAYWRDSFGTFEPETGSHGCPNLSPPTAKLLFDWAEVGDTVVTRSS